VYVPSLRNAGNPNIWPSSRSRRVSLLFAFIAITSDVQFPIFQGLEALPPPQHNPQGQSVKSRAQPGTVYLVGAGPGNPGLLTLRALSLLQTADVILPDDLVSDEVLDLANSNAKIIRVGKRNGRPSITQAGIHSLMLEHSRAQRSVLRLKSGDPLIFGRAGEEMAALRTANIPFEVVPGITAALAVAATLKTPLTDRNGASKLILATAHHASGRLTIKPSWTNSLPPESTLVIYMPGRDFATLAKELVESGLPPVTPCIAVSKGTSADQHVINTSIENLGTARIGPAPVLLIIGQTIQLPETE
jgi:uroporphyrin-III C-methyltransferase